MNSKLLILLLVFSLSISIHLIAQKSTLVLHFESYVGTQKMQLDTVAYYNSLKQVFTVTNFKYYISNISLTASNGKDYVIPNSYYLIKQDEPDTWSAAIEGIPVGEYKFIHFIIGVDSLHNCSGAQSGALDPVQGMFWAWNTGYIFMKLEGKAPVSKSSGHIYEYHIGGYHSPANCIRKVSLSFTKNLLKINSSQKSAIYIKADAAEILRTPTTIDFSILSSVTDFHHATRVADNYKDMFSIIKVGYEK